MANPGEIRTIFEMLQANYHYAMRNMTPKEISNLQILWVELLRDIDTDILKAAALQHASESNWFPSVAELRNAAAEIVTPNRTTPVEQWGEVVRQFKHPGHCSIPYFCDEITAAVVADMGWLNLCMSEDATADRARFIQGYTDRQKRDRRLAVQLPQVADAIARLVDKRRMQLRSGEK